MEITTNAKVNMPDNSTKEIDVIIWEHDGELQIRNVDDK